MTNTEAPVTVACQNDAVPEEHQPRYLAAGTWVVSFGSGFSFEKEHASDDDHQSAVAETFNRMAEASRVGGIGTLRARGTDLYLVGRFSSDGLALQSIPRDGGTRMKTLQFEEYALVGPTDDTYGTVEDIGDTKGSTVAGLSDEDAGRLNQLLVDFEEQGRLRTPLR